MTYILIYVPEILSKRAVSICFGGSQYNTLIWKSARVPCCVAISKITIYTSFIVLAYLAISGHKDIYNAIHKRVIIYGIYMSTLMVVANWSVFYELFARKWKNWQVLSAIAILVLKNWILSTSLFGRIRTFCEGLVGKIESKTYMMMVIREIKFNEKKLE